ncbi:MAG: hypothetical protein K2R98_25735, partial [Gemmataceae bacterium]|nr:hypothetical protein [Gemmataceae bacterium]
TVANVHLYPHTYVHTHTNTHTITSPHTRTQTNPHTYTYYNQHPHTHRNTYVGSFGNGSTYRYTTHYTTYTNTTNRTTTYTRQQTRTYTYRQTQTHSQTRTTTYTQTTTNQFVPTTTTPGGFGANGGRAQGAGLYVNGGLVTITNSTLANNAAQGGDGGDAGLGFPNGAPGGGGISSGGAFYLVSGTVNLFNVTIADNRLVASTGGGTGDPFAAPFGAPQGGFGGGGFNSGGTVNAVNSLFARSVAAGPSGSPASGNGPDFYGAFASARNNLLSDGTGSNLAAANPDANGNIVGSGAAPINPGLGTLADNGGQTQTLALLTGSRAIATGTASGLPVTDQRDLLRSAPDIGAYAFNTVTSPFGLPTSTITLPTAGGSFDATSWSNVFTGTASSNGGSGIAQVQVSVVQNSTGLFWDGTAFAGSSEVLLTATGTTSWSFGFAATNFPAAGTYTVHSVATDVAGHVDAGARMTFTFNRAPVPPPPPPAPGIGPEHVGVFRNGTWFLDSVQGDYSAATTTQVSFGAAGDVPVTGDWLGDGIQRIGIFRNGTWFLSTTNAAYSSATTIEISFGQAGDVAVVGDWTGDGEDHIGIFRPSTGTWYLDTRSRTAGTATGYDLSATIQINFGARGDIPVVGAWLGGTVDRVGIFRGGNWFLDTQTRSPGTATGYDGSTTIQVHYGARADTPVVGAWNGDGVAHIGVFRAGTWFLDTQARSAGTASGYDGTSTIQVNYGARGDVPVVGKWNGDGVDHIAVFRGGSWFLDIQARPAGSAGSYVAGTTIQIGFGGFGDRPLHGTWQQGTAQMLDGTSLTDLGAAQLLAYQLTPVVQEAVRRWGAAGLDDNQFAMLRGTSVVIADLPDGWLGEYLPGVVLLDVDASGAGWYVDSTPQDDAGIAGNAVDLLTVVMHEMGHALGLPDLPGAGNASDLMAESLAAGLRRAPLPSDIGVVLSHWH